MEVRNWDMARCGAARHVPIPNLLPDSGAVQGWGGRRCRPPQPRDLQLLAQAQSADDLFVALRVRATQIGQMTAPLAHHPEQPPSGVLVVLVDLQVFRQLIDPTGENRNLDLRRASVLRRAAVIPDNLLLLALTQRHTVFSLLRSSIGGAARPRRFSRVFYHISGSRQAGPSSPLPPAPLPSPGLRRVLRKSPCGNLFCPLSPLPPLPRRFTAGEIVIRILFLWRQRSRRYKNNFFFYPFPPGRRACPHFLSSLFRGEEGQGGKVKMGPPTDVDTRGINRALISPGRVGNYLDKSPLR